MKISTNVIRFLHRRPGVGLPLALVIVVVGSSLMALIFGMSTRFSETSTWQRMIYRDQVLVSSYIEKAKGEISAKIETDVEAFHPLPGDEWNAGSEKIGSLRDLQVFIKGPTAADEPLSIDTLEGARRVVMRVYDLTYDVTWISDDISPTERLRLPSPLAIVDDVKEIVNTIDVDGERDDGSVKDPETDISYLKPDRKTIGAYLIRVGLFDPDRGVLVRTTEEAFFQLTSSAIGMVSVESSDP